MSHHPAAAEGEMRTSADAVVGGETEGVGRLESFMDTVQASRSIGATPAPIASMAFISFV